MKSVIKDAVPRLWEFDRGTPDTSSRGNYIITLQDSTVDLLRGFVFASSDKLVIGDRVWPGSVNIPLRDLEDALLGLAQSGRQGKWLEFNQPPEGMDEDLTTKSVKSRTAKYEEHAQWVEGLGANLIIAADGADSLTRRTYDHIFKWTKLGACYPDAAHSDYLLEMGVKAMKKPSPETPKPQGPILTTHVKQEEPFVPQSKALNAVLSVSNLRYMFTGCTDKFSHRGTVSIRLLAEEYNSLLEAAGAMRTPSVACDAQDFYVKANSEKDESPLKPNVPEVRKAVAEGLRLFGYTECHVKSLNGIALTPCYARKFVHSTMGGLLCLVGDAAMTQHCFGNRDLDSALRGVVALGRAVNSTRGVGDLPEAMRKFDNFMQVLREREMQGRSASLLAPSSQLPEWISEDKDTLTTEAHAGRSNNDGLLCRRLKAWRSYLSKLRDTEEEPVFSKLTDEVIDDKILRGRTRPRPLTSMILAGAASPNAGLLAGCPAPQATAEEADLCGWPLVWQLGTEKVTGEVTPAEELQGLPHIQPCKYCWPKPLVQLSAAASQQQTSQ
eukprot:TRINITY_DN48396_c0_g1_i1.p1 TRINITY_DN48396_c0_g1~~TRINITY_DN48396_c0_g1_i1.p1  ORF type:complete len:554 (-),score=110.63 TRINITY_DN48396_c0_g1_i1:180-1841(-)